MSCQVLQKDTSFHVSPMALCFFATLIRAGGLLKHTIASAFKVFRTVIERVLTCVGAQYFHQSTRRPDVGVYVKHWSLQIGWVDDADISVAARPYRRACDIARPLP